MTSLSSTGAAALALAVEYGAAVFPCEGKRPHSTLAPHGFHCASSHPEQVAAWWAADPNANIGLRPDSIGALVVDVDGPEGERLAREWGAFDVETCEVITRTGMHRYYAMPRGVTLGNLHREQLDVRHAAGYVLVPPSVHPSGHVYAWRGSLDTLAPIPPRLLEALTRASERADVAAAIPFPAPSTAAPAARRIARYIDAMGTVGEGGRNQAAFRLAAFALHDCQLDAASVGAIVAAWNLEQCAPPLGGRELAAVLRSATTRRRAA